MINTQADRAKDKGHVSLTQKINTTIFPHLVTLSVIQSIFGLWLERSSSILFLLLAPFFLFSPHISHPHPEGRTQMTALPDQWTAITRRDMVNVSPIFRSKPKLSLQLHQGLVYTENTVFMLRTVLFTVHYSRLHWPQLGVCYLKHCDILDGTQAKK